jgi:hypothetical protein
MAWLKVRDGGVRAAVILVALLLCAGAAPAAGFAADEDLGNTEATAPDNHENDQDPPVDQNESQGGGARG